MHINFTFYARISPSGSASWTALSTHSNFVGLRVYAYLDVTWHLHFWQNDQGLLLGFEIATCCYRVWHSQQQAIPAEYT